MTLYLYGGAAGFEDNRFSVRKQDDKPLYAR